MSEAVKPKPKRKNKKKKEPLRCYRCGRIMTPRHKFVYVGGAPLCGSREGCL